MKIKIKDYLLEMELKDTPTAKVLTAALPFSGNAILWGKEIYFSIPVNVEMEQDAKALVDVGDVAFYPPMNAFCIFFGPTPASTDDQPMGADIVNVFGKIKGDLSFLNQVKMGEKIEVLAS